MKLHNYQHLIHLSTHFAYKTSQNTDCTYRDRECSSKLSCSFFNPDVFKVSLLIDYQPTCRRTGVLLLLTMLHLLIEFPLWCNCIAKDYRREWTQVTTLGRVLLSLQPMGPLSAAPQRQKIGRWFTKAL